MRAPHGAAVKVARFKGVIWRGQPTNPEGYWHAEINEAY